MDVIKLLSDLGWDADRDSTRVSVIHMYVCKYICVYTYTHVCRDVNFFTYRYKHTVSHRLKGFMSAVSGFRKGFVRVLELKQKGGPGRQADLCRPLNRSSNINFCHGSS